MDSSGSRVAQYDLPRPGVADVHSAPTSLSECEDVGLRAGTLEVDLEPAFVDVAIRRTSWYRRGFIEETVAFGVGATTTGRRSNSRRFGVIRCLRYQRMQRRIAER